MDKVENVPTLSTYKTYAQDDGSYLKAACSPGFPTQAGYDAYGASSRRANWSSTKSAPPPAAASGTKTAR